MQKVWSKPELETLDLSMTMAGPGLQFLDQFVSDPDEFGELHHS
ncbi:paeninodin family lasso peptide [Paenibacillus roseipurpureus]|uniref:Paeninodin family lasso peptide n=1 Tax=Paenibacillus roseopurpureus TaxID=2918901 RepID=A0AA96LL92_9BACL|nr:paeninodin family lasso peptide [Paenibacillus sp. MBLB1832]WNR43815.1 paeninodin family lasso peptide [Paenibacillus sp. MBLB1832]